MFNYNYNYNFTNEYVATVYSDITCGTVGNYIFFSFNIML